MKKIYLSLLCFSAIVLTQAQSLSQANHAYAVGDTYKTVDCGTVTPGPSGSGVTWNFSTLSVGTSTTTYSVVTAASTGSASSYPSASVAVQTGTNNNFYSSSVTDQKFWGGNIQVSGQSIEARFTSPAIVAQYPMAYNTGTTSTIAGTAYLLSFSASFTGNSSVMCDGLGTLQLPARTFTSVLRVVTTQTLNYTLFGINGSVKTEVYDFYAPGLSKSPLLSISNGTFTQGSNSTPQTLTFIKGDYETIGIRENAKDVISLSVYPNPASSQVTVGLYNEDASPVSCELINVLGQTVKKEFYTSDKGNVKLKFNLENVDNGTYFMKVYCGGKTAVQKVTVQ